MAKRVRGAKKDQRKTDGEINPSQAVSLNSNSCPPLSSPPSASVPNHGDASLSNASVSSTIGDLPRNYPTESEVYQSQEKLPLNYLPMNQSNLASGGSTHTDGQLLDNKTRLFRSRSDSYDMRSFCDVDMQHPFYFRAHGLSMDNVGVGSLTGSNGSLSSGNLPSLAALSSLSKTGKADGEIFHLQAQAGPIPSSFQALSSSRSQALDIGQLQPHLTSNHVGVEQTSESNSTAFATYNAPSRQSVSRNDTGTSTSIVSSSTQDLVSLYEQGGFEKHLLLVGNSLTDTQSSLVTDESRLLPPDGKLLSPSAMVHGNKISDKVGSRYLSNSTGSVEIVDRPQVTIIKGDLSIGSVQSTVRADNQALLTMVNDDSIGSCAVNDSLREHNADFSSVDYGVVQSSVASDCLSSAAAGQTNEVIKNANNSGELLKKSKSDRKVGNSKSRGNRSKAARTSSSACNPAIDPSASQPVTATIPEIKAEYIDKIRSNDQACSANKIKLTDYFERQKVVTDRINYIESSKIMARLCPPSIVSRRKIHWDYVQEEAQWLALDFRQELRWKLSANKHLSEACLLQVQSLKKKEHTSTHHRIECNLDLQVTAKKISSIVENAWRITKHIKVKPSPGMSSTQLSTERLPLESTIDRILAIPRVENDYEYFIDKEKLYKRFDGEQTPGSSVDSERNSKIRLLPHQQSMIDQVLSLNFRGFGAGIHGCSFVGKTVALCSVLENWFCRFEWAQQESTLREFKPLTVLPNRVAVTVVFTVRCACIRVMTECRRYYKQGMRKQVLFHFWSPSTSLLDVLSSRSERKEEYSGESQLLLFVPLESVTGFLQSSDFKKSANLERSTHQICFVGAALDLRGYSPSTFGQWDASTPETSIGSSQTSSDSYDWVLKLAEFLDENSTRTGYGCCLRCLVSDNSLVDDADDCVIPFLRYLVPFISAESWHQHFTPSRESLNKNDFHQVQLKRSTLLQMFSTLCVHVEVPRSAGTVVMAKAREEVVSVNLTPTQHKEYSLLVGQLLEDPLLHSGACTSMLARTLTALRLVCFHGEIMKVHHVSIPRKESTLGLSPTTVSAMFHLDDETGGDIGQNIADHLGNHKEVAELFTAPVQDLALSSSKISKVKGKQKKDKKSGNPSQGIGCDSDFIDDQSSDPVTLSTATSKLAEQCVLGPSTLSVENSDHVMSNNTAVYVTDLSHADKPKSGMKRKADGETVPGQSSMALKLPREDQEASSKPLICSSSALSVHISRRGRHAAKKALGEGNSLWNCQENADVCCLTSNKLGALEGLLKRFYGQKIVIVVESALEQQLVADHLTYLQTPFMLAGKTESTFSPATAVEYALSCSGLATLPGCQKKDVVDWPVWAQNVESKVRPKSWFAAQLAVNSFNEAPPDSTAVLLATSSAFRVPSVIPSNADAVVILSESWITKLEVRNCFRLRLMSAGPSGEPVTIVRVVGASTLEDLMARKNVSFPQLQGCNLLDISKRETVASPRQLSGNLVHQTKSIPTVSRNTVHSSSPAHRSMLFRAPSILPVSDETTGVIAGSMVSIDSASSRSSSPNPSCGQEVINISLSEVPNITRASRQEDAAESTSTIKSIDTIDQVRPQVGVRPASAYRGKGTIVLGPHGTTSFIKPQPSLNSTCSESSDKRTLLGNSTNSLPPTSDIQAVSGSAFSSRKKVSARSSLVGARSGILCSLQSLRRRKDDPLLELRLNYATHADALRWLFSLNVKQLFSEWELLISESWNASGKDWEDLFGELARHDAVALVSTKTRAPVHTSSKSSSIGDLIPDEDVDGGDCVGQRSSRASVDSLFELLPKSHQYRRVCSSVNGISGNIFDALIDSWLLDDVCSASKVSYALKAAYHSQTTRHDWRSETKWICRHPSMFIDDVRQFEALSVDNNSALFLKRMEKFRKRCLLASAVRLGEKSDESFDEEETFLSKVDREMNLVNFRHSKIKSFPSTPEFFYTERLLFSTNVAPVPLLHERDSIADNSKNSDDGEGSTEALTSLIQNSQSPSVTIAPYDTFFQMLQGMKSTGEVCETHLAVNPLQLACKFDSMMHPSYHRSFIADSAVVHMMIVDGASARDVKLFRRKALAPSSSTSLELLWNPKQPVNAEVSKSPDTLINLPDAPVKDLKKVNVKKKSKGAVASVVSEILPASEQNALGKRSQQFDAAEYRSNSVEEKNEVYSTITQTTPSVQQPKKSTKKQKVEKKQQNSWFDHTVIHSDYVHSVGKISENVNHLSGRSNETINFVADYLPLNGKIEANSENESASAVDWTSEEDDIIVCMQHGFDDPNFANTISWLNSSTTKKQRSVADARQRYNELTTSGEAMKRLHSENVQKNMAKLRLLVEKRRSKSEASQQFSITTIDSLSSKLNA